GVAWQTYVGVPSFGSGACDLARTSTSVQPAPDVARAPWLDPSIPLAPLPDELPIGFSHASFQKIRHPAWHPPCAAPSQRVFKWTARSTRRPRAGLIVSQVLCARL